MPRVLAFVLHWIVHGGLILSRDESVLGSVTLNRDESILGGVTFDLDESILGNVTLGLDEGILEGVILDIGFGDQPSKSGKLMLMLLVVGCNEMLKVIHLTL